MAVVFAASKIVFAVCIIKNNPNPIAIKIQMLSTIAVQNISAARPITANNSEIYPHRKQPFAVAISPFSTPMAPKNPSILVYVIAVPLIDDDKYHIPTPNAIAPIINRMAMDISVAFIYRLSFRRI